MAQTKRKRQTKHRGNAAGEIEARGRTGRPPTAEERKRAERAKTRESRLTRRPTWKQAVQRSLLAGVLMFIFLVLTQKHTQNRLLVALIFSVLAVGIYIPGGYYLELYMWRRRMAKRHGGGARR